jgi:hypothetical protein
VDPQLGYPLGYAKLCSQQAAAHGHGQQQQEEGGDSVVTVFTTPYSRGPPQRFLPYSPVTQNSSVSLKDWDNLFPVVSEADSRHHAPPKSTTTTTREYVHELWQQLDHLGNAGFDPDKFRVDFYGNVLYWNADPSSPLAWEVDHWFPHARMSQQNPNSKQNPGRKKPFMFWCVYMYPLTSGPTRQILLCLTARNRTLPNDQTPRIDGFGSVQRPSRRRI